MDIKFIITPTPSGYIGKCDSAEIVVEGNTLLEIQKNALEDAINYFSRSKPPKSVCQLDFEIDYQDFFDSYKVINSKHLAQRIGMNESLLSQYVNGKKKPSMNQVNRIVAGIHEIGKELYELKLFIK